MIFTKSPLHKIQYTYMKDHDPDPLAQALVSPA